MDTAEFYICSSSGASVYLKYLGYNCVTTYNYSVGIVDYQQLMKT